MILANNILQKNPFGGYLAAMGKRNSKVEKDPKRLIISAYKSNTENILKYLNGSSYKRDYCPDFLMGIADRYN